MLFKSFSVADIDEAIRYTYEMLQKDEFGDSYYMEFFDDECRSQINTDGDAECYVRAVRSIG